MADDGRRARPRGRDGGRRLAPRRRHRRRRRAPRSRHRPRDQGRLRGPQRDLDRRHQPDRRRAGGDGLGRPPGPAARRHDLLAGLDRLPPRRVEGRRHRRRLPEGPDAAAGPVLQRRQRQGARGPPHGRHEALLLGLDADPGGQREGDVALHPGHQPALRPRGRPRHAGRRGPGERVRAPPALGARHARRRRGLGPRGALPRRARALRRPDRRGDARGARRRRAARPHPGALRHVAGCGPDEARRSGLPDRAPRPLRGLVPGRHAGRGGDGSRPRRRPVHPGRRPGRPRRAARGLSDHDDDRAPREHRRPGRGPAGLRRGPGGRGRGRGRLRRLQPPPVLPGREHVRDPPPGRGLPPPRRRRGGRRPRRRRARCPGDPARGRHQPGRSDDRRGHRARPVAAHEPDPRPRPRAAYGSGRGRRGAGRAEPGGGAVRADVRPGHLDQQPGHHRRDDRQQLRRQRVAAVRDDDRPRPRARRGALGRLDGALRARRRRGGAPAGLDADPGGLALPRAAADRRGEPESDRRRHAAVLAPGLRLPPGPPGRPRDAVRPGDLRRRLRGDPGHRHRRRGRSGP
ncbi:hypothetical protein NOCARDAX2BIS_400104 [Nocardioides sp. AX2bis]|nr:hypothetical protein NOCARDAX2BIS_400104 [Nocardioides sp. AX2bis]